MEIPPGDGIQHERERWVQRAESEIFTLQLEQLFSGRCLGKMPGPWHCQSFRTTPHSEEALFFHYRGPFSSHICKEGPINIARLSGRQPATHPGLAPETRTAICVTAGCVEVFSLHLTGVICWSGPPDGGNHIMQFLCKVIPAFPFPSGTTGWMGDAGWTGDE